MSEWISVKDATPKQGVRVLLAIEYENCPVVGYWGCGEYEPCTVNLRADDGGYGNGATVESAFDSDEVTHWMALPEVPE